MDINSLPVEVLDHILSIVDMIACSFVCQLWTLIIFEIKKRDPKQFQFRRKKYLREYRYPIPLTKVFWIINYLHYPTEHAAYYAVLSDQKKVLKWAINKEKQESNGLITDIPWIITVARSAVREGPLRMLKWFIKNGVTSNKYCYSAAAGGRVETLEFLANDDTQDWQISADCAAACGELSALQWLVTVKNIVPTDTTMRYAIKNGHKHIVEYLHGNGMNLTESFIIYASAWSTIEILEWFVSKGCPMIRDHCAIPAAINQREEIIKWLFRDQNMARELYNLLGKSILYLTNSRVPITSVVGGIIYLCELLGRCYPNQVFMHDGTCSRAIILGNLELVTYLGIRYPDGMFLFDKSAALSKCSNPDVVKWYQENVRAGSVHIHVLPQNVINIIFCYVGAIVPSFVCRKWRALTYSLVGNGHNKATLMKERVTHLWTAIRNRESMNKIIWLMETLRYPCDYLVGIAAKFGYLEAFQYGLELMSVNVRALSVNVRALSVNVRALSVNDVNYYFRYMKTCEKLREIGTGISEYPANVLSNALCHGWLRFAPSLIKHGYPVTSNSIVCAAQHQEEHIIYFLCDRAELKKSYFVKFMCESSTVQLLDIYAKIHPGAVNFLISMFVGCMFPFAGRVWVSKTGIKRKRNEE